jgi:hypothetical protein
MRSLLCVLALTSCTPISTGPDGHLFDAPPKPDAAPMIDSGIDARAGRRSELHLGVHGLALLRDGGDVRELRLRAVPPLLDGTVYEAVACLDPA